MPNLMQNERASKFFYEYENWLTNAIADNFHFGRDISMHLIFSLLLDARFACAERSLKAPLERVCRMALHPCLLLLLGIAFGSTLLAHPSSGIVVNPQGDVYFVDERRNIVWKVDGSGRLSRLASNLHSHQLRIDAAGNLYGESVRFLPHNNSWEGSLWKATPKGVVSLIHGPAPGFPPGLLVDDQGHRFETYERADVSPPISQIRLRARDGTITVVAGASYGQVDGRGLRAKIQSVQAMTLAADGALYFTEIDAVRRLSRDGIVRTLVSGLRANKDTDLPIQKLWGLVVDEIGTVYVADFGQRRVLRIAQDGIPVAILHAQKPWSPTGVALLGTTLYVLEHGFVPPATSLGPRVRKLAPNGQVEIMAVVKD
jgi:hypothetical protein